MPRYIDADALLLKVQVESTEAIATDISNEGFVAFCKGVRRIVEKSIGEMPAADVQEVKHGKWEKGKRGNYFVCSKCGQISDFFKYDYCPGCGARMDGETND